MSAIFVMIVVKDVPERTVLGLHHRSFRLRPPPSPSLDCCIIAVVVIRDAPWRNWYRSMVAGKPYGIERFGGECHSFRDTDSRFFDSRKACVRRTVITPTHMRSASANTRGVGREIVVPLVVQLLPVPICYHSPTGPHYERASCDEIQIWTRPEIRIQRSHHWCTNEETKSGQNGRSVYAASPSTGRPDIGL